VGSGAGVGVGGNWDWITCLKAGASNPAKVQVFPWQALFEQNEVFETPPGSFVSWQFEQVALNTWLCWLIQFSFL
jgi:hypothetical protein